MNGFNRETRSIYTREHGARIRFFLRARDGTGGRRGSKSLRKERRSDINGAR